MLEENIRVTVLVSACHFICLSLSFTVCFHLEKRHFVQGWWSYERISKARCRYKWPVVSSVCILVSDRPLVTRLRCPQNFSVIINTQEYTQTHPLTSISDVAASLALSQRWWKNAIQYWSDLNLWGTSDWHTRTLWTLWRGLHFSSSRQFTFAF